MRVLRPQADLPALSAAEPPDGGNAAAMPSNARPSREEIDAKIALAKADGRNELVRLEAKFDMLERSLSVQLNALSNDIRRTRDETRDARTMLVVTIIASALFIAAILIVMMNAQDAGYRRGLAVRDAVPEMREHDSLRSPATVKPSAR
jgi:hypothetical protein